MWLPLSFYTDKIQLKNTQKQDIRRLRAKRDEDIDLSDAPVVLDWSKAEVGKFYRPPKKPVTMRLDVDIIDWLKAEGRGYQTKANWLLRSAMLHFRKRTRHPTKMRPSKLSRR